MTKSELIEAMARAPGEYVPHVHKDGARFHVLSWGAYYDSKGEMHSERRCSEPRCEINREADRRLAMIEAGRLK